MNSDTPVQFGIVGVGLSRRPVSIFLDSPNDKREITYSPVDTYQLQVEDFARAVRGGQSMLDIEEGYRNAVIIDALLASARQDGIRVPLAM